MTIRAIRTLCAIAALALLSPSFAQAAGPINVAASNWTFTPSIITLKVNEPAVLHLTSTEGVHGLMSPDLGLPMTTLAPGQPVNVTITPRKTGTYVLPCEVFCGAGHSNMKLIVKVVP